MLFYSCVFSPESRTLFPETINSNSKKGLCYARPTDHWFNNVSSSFIWVSAQASLSIYDPIHIPILSAFHHTSVVFNRKDLVEHLPQKTKKLKREKSSSVHCMCRTNLHWQPWRIYLLVFTKKIMIIVLDIRDMFRLSKNEKPWVTRSRSDRNLNCSSIACRKACRLRVKIHLNKHQYSNDYKQTLLDILFLICS